jgi:hypothetical protein
VYSDTPAGTYTWGTLAHVKERENPDFTANTTLHTDYSSTYGWTTNSGWEVSAKDEFSNGSYPAWEAFSKNHSADNNWMSNSAPSTSSPQWIRIKYPSAQVIKSYMIRARHNASPRFPTAWKLQGSVSDGTTWVDIGSEQTQTAWARGRDKSFDVSTNTTAYTKYQLRISTTIKSASDSTSDYAAIAGWKLYTLNSENNTVHDSHTEYAYTPPGTGTITANVLRVAGGGAAGNTRSGGGGAGGLLYSENVSLSGAKKIVVGNGGEGKIGNGDIGDNGHNTLFEGLTTVVGGGGTAGENFGAAGGSSGGNGGRNTSAATAPYPSGQGNAGGTAGADNFQGAGGGGAGGVGTNQSGSAHGGVGVDYSSVFGTTYGDSGWFAGGGGGATGGSGGNGGGGDGTNTGTPGPGQKHTGGGAGGRGNSDPTNKMADGGSGIVIIKKDGATNPPALNFDGYNKLSIDNVSLSPDPFPNTISITYNNLFGSGGGSYCYKLSSSPPSSSTSNFYELYTSPTGTLHGATYGIEFRHESDGTTKLYVNSDDNSAQPATVKTNDTTTSAVDVVLTSNTTEVILENTAGSSYYATFNVTSDMFFKNEPPDTSVTIKKDGAAFATTTSNTVYIRNAGTYTAEVKGLSEYVTEVSKVVSDTPTQKLAYKSTVQKLLPSSDGTVSDNDHYAFPGISGNGLVMVIAGYGDDDTTDNSGGFMVYEKVDGVWTFTQQITGVGTGSGVFGYSEEGKAVQLDYAGTRVFIGDWHSESHGSIWRFCIHIQTRCERKLDSGTKNRLTSIASSA